MKYFLVFSSQILKKNISCLYVILDSCRIFTPLLNGEFAWKSYSLECVLVNNLVQASILLNILILGFIPKADASRAHHMLLYACSEPLQEPGTVSMFEIFRWFLI